MDVISRMKDDWWKTVKNDGLFYSALGEKSWGKMGVDDLVHKVKKMIKIQWMWPNKSESIYEKDEVWSHENLNRQ